MLVVVVVVVVVVVAIVVCGGVTVRFVDIIVSFWHTGLLGVNAIINNNSCYVWLLLQAWRS